MSVLVAPSRRIRGIGSFSRLGAVADDDSKILIAASTDDLILLGKVLSAYRRIVSQKMGGVIGEFKVIFTAVEGVVKALNAVGLAPDQHTMNALAGKNELQKTASDGVQYLGAIDNYLDAIANILVTRKPGWQVTYIRYSDGSITNVVNRSATDDLEQVSLDYGGRFADCASFIYKNRDVLDRLKHGAGLAAAGPMLVVIIIVVLALAAVIFLITAEMAMSKSVESKRLEESLRKNTEQIAYNTSKMNQNATEMSELLQIAPNERTASDNARLAALQNENAKLLAESRGLEAQNVVVRDGLDKLQKSENLLEQLASTLSSGFKYLIYGGVGIILIGLVLWIWRPFK